MSGNSPSWRQAAVVVTTIGGGDFLDIYAEAARREGVLDKVQFIVIPDRKTPPTLAERCREHAARGLRVVCPTLADQEAYLAKLALTDFIPYDSDNRRNIGFLMALEAGCDFLISIDDDNFCRPGEPFFGEHAVVCCGEAEADVLETSIGWFNLCTLMEMSDTGVYPRGFPYKHRHKESTVTRSRRSCRIRMNAGLWLNDPDVDAMTWLTRPSRALAHPGSEAVCLGPRAWSPINTQNTAIHRDLIAAYYFVRMNYPVGNGIQIDRFGDIFSGYFAATCLHHMGDALRVGTPAADHRRNTHHYLRDATMEIGAIWAIEDLSDWFTQVRLEGKTYPQSYRSLADALDQVVEGLRGFIWTPATRAYFHDMAFCMRRWAHVCEKIG